jgi:hypothetical protein
MKLYAFLIAKKGTEPSWSGVRQLAAAWIIGLLASSGSPPNVPEPVRIAFHSFSDIENPGTYAASDDSLRLQATYKASADAKFNLTEWWKIAEGEKLSKSFDVGEELVAGLLRALEMVSTLFYMWYL